jgi:hypothetical protein
VLVLVLVLMLVLVLVLDVGLGAGAGAPVVSICPANAGTASVRLRIVTALIRRKVFILLLLRELQKICSHNEASMIGL